MEVVNVVWPEDDFGYDLIENNEDSVCSGV